MAPGGRLLSIASGGDNALALLTLDPAEVVAVDQNPAQLACLSLRIAAFRGLSDDSLLAFLGLLPAPDRLRAYAGLRNGLPDAARDYWDARPRAVRRGIIHAGRFERYLRGFGRWVLPLIHSRETVRLLRKERSHEEREAFYRERWDSPRWRLLFRLFFSRWVMSRAGRDPAFFSQAEGPIAERLLARTRHALTALPTRTNPYLAYILEGTFPPEARPRYLDAEHRPVIRARLDRLRLVEAPIEAAGAGQFHGFNLSDVFEYMTPEEHARCYAALVCQARPGARLVYWNMLVPRARPPELAPPVRPLEALAGELHARDRAWFYGALHVDEVAGSSPD